MGNDNNYLVTMLWLETKKKIEEKKNKEDNILVTTSLANENDTTSNLHEEKTNTVINHNKEGYGTAEPLPFSTISRHLDELGWTKILVDTRSELPCLKKMVSIKNRKEDECSMYESDSKDDKGRENSNNDHPSLGLLQQFPENGKCYTSS